MTIYIQFVTEEKMELPVVMDACGIKRSQNAYVRKLTFWILKFYHIIEFAANTRQY